MAIIEDTIGGEVLAEAGLGAGIMVLVPALLRGLARPAAKALIRSGIVLYRGATELIDEAALDRRVSPVPQRSETPRLRARRTTADDKPKVAAKRRATRKAGPGGRKKG
jgi:hypothetical protein